MRVRVELGADWAATVPVEAAAVGRAGGRSYGACHSKIVRHYIGQPAQTERAERGTRLPWHLQSPPLPARKHTYNIYMPNHQTPYRYHHAPPLTTTTTVAAGATAVPTASSLSSQPSQPYLRYRHPSLPTAERAAASTPRRTPPSCTPPLVIVVQDARARARARAASAGQSTV